MRYKHYKRLKGIWNIKGWIKYYRQKFTCRLYNLKPLDKTEDKC